MMQLVNSLSEEIIENYWYNVKGKTQREIFKFYIPETPDQYTMCSSELSHRIDEENIYFKSISKINYALAEKLSRDNDLILENGVVIPFYFYKLHGREYSIEDWGIMFDGVIDFNVSQDEEKAYFSEKIEKKYRAIIEDNKILEYATELIHHKREENLTKYSVRYELYSPWEIDPGATVDVYASSPEEAIQILSSVKDSPDSPSYSYEVDNEPIGSQHNSYFEMIEKPGVAAAEAKLRSA